MTTHMRPNSFAAVSPCGRFVICTGMYVHDCLVMCDKYIIFINIVVIVVLGGIVVFWLVN